MGLFMWLRKCVEICCGVYVVVVDLDICGKFYFFVRLKRRVRGISGGIFNYEDWLVGRFGISYGYLGV